MNLNQAKAVAGISPSQTIAGRAGLQMAIRHCKESIIAARRRGDDKHAAELSEAKEVFRRRLKRNTCAVCGVTIGMSAKFCRIHHRRKSLPFPGCNPVVAGPKGNVNARIDVSPKGGLIARFGFYARPVQIVFKKWKMILEPEIVKSCLIGVAHDLRMRQVSLVRIPRGHWQCALELAAALTSVLMDRTSPQGWLLNHIHVLQVADGETGFSGWAEIAKQTGGRFSASRLSKAAERLQLLTPAPIAESYRRAVKTK